MKLYATVTSERASKGQGGEWLDIDIFTTSKDHPTHRITVRDEQGEITVHTLVHHFGKWRDFAIRSKVFTNYKGKRQKGECNYVSEDSNLCITHDIEH